MSRDRLLAVVLMLVFVVALAAQWAFPFVRDASEVVGVAVTIVGVASALVAARLWVRGGVDRGGSE